MSDYFDRQRREAAQREKHQTMETYQLEQQEAHQGNIPDPKKYDVDPPKPGLLGRIKRLLGGKR